MHEKVLHGYFQSGDLETKPIGGRTYLLYYYDHDKHGQHQSKTQGQNGDPYLNDNRKKRYRDYKDLDPKDRKR